MKKITPLDIDDIQIMQNLCNKTSTASSPYLSQEYLVMKLQYEKYIRNSGIPWLCPKKNISNLLASKLEYHYEKSSPKALFDFIPKIRNELSPRACPMCGSLGVSSVDHYLPRTDYPEWAIFSKNLVPACNCNSKRSNNVCGIQPNERVFHPYYDDALLNRLISCHFSGELEAPTIKVTGLDVANVSIDMTEYHLNEVVRKTNIENWLEDTWEQLRLYPSSIIVNIDDDQLITIDELIIKLNKLLGKHDRQHGTPNNWYSIFFHGLIHNVEVLEWIVLQQNGIVNGAIVPV